VSEARPTGLSRGQIHVFMLALGTRQRLVT